MKMPFALTLVVCAAFATPTLAQRFTGLSVFPGGKLSNAQAVNAYGTVVVGFADTPAGTRAFRWTAPGPGTGGLENLGVLTNGTTSTAYSISADGDTIVGYCTLSTPPTTNPMQPSAGPRAAGMQSLGVLPGATNSTANAISALPTARSLTALAASPPRTRFFGFRWTPTTQMSSLGVLPGGVSSIAYAASTDGSVITGLAFVGGWRAFRWTTAATRHGEPRAFSQGAETAVRLRHQQRRIGHRRVQRILRRYPRLPVDHVGHGEPGNPPARHFVGRPCRER